MGVSRERLRVGADWAWLYRSGVDLGAWAAAYWQELGIDPERPLLVANIVNLCWRNRREEKRTIAAALDEAAAAMHLQLAFFCNESRRGPDYDFAAASEVASLLRHPAVLVPNLYYSPDETLALLRRACVTVGERYHFVVQSILADVMPVAILRGQKMRSLVEDTQTPVGGHIECIQPDVLAAAIVQALVERPTRGSALIEVRDRMAIRARQNLAFADGFAEHRP
jgi:polysaccharide pyruvyl transferase WcaK-like protein